MTSPSAQKDGEQHGAANTTWLGEPSMPDLGKSSVSAGASTSAKMNESMPSSVQPSHAAKIAHLHRGQRHNVGSHASPPLRYRSTLAQNRAARTAIRGNIDRMANRIELALACIFLVAGKSRGQTALPPKRIRPYSRLRAARCAARTRRRITIPVAAFARKGARVASHVHRRTASSSVIREYPAGECGRPRMAQTGLGRRDAAAL